MFLDVKGISLLFFQCSYETSLLKYRNHLWAKFQIKDFLAVLILKMMQAYYWAGGGRGGGEERGKTARKPSATQVSAWPCDVALSI